eukprot:10006477-Lingulodinium_polyedra.AAC.1
MVFARVPRGPSSGRRCAVDGCARAMHSPPEGAALRGRWARPHSAQGAVGAALHDREAGPRSARPAS